tara:strand:+ start:670 stop:936 length:267 start_codon:yes stop_codon:yes gene_type:complete
MKDLFLQLESDPEVQDLLSTLTEDQKSQIILEMKEISNGLNNSLQLLASILVDEDSVIKFIDTLGKSISMSNINENIGSETIDWPEKR